MSRRNFAAQKYSAPTLRAWLIASLAIIFVLSAALGGSWLYFFHTLNGAHVASLATATPGPAAPPSVSPLLVTHQLDLPGRGEVFPALAASASGTNAAKDYWPLALLTISNSGDRPVLETISIEIAGWSRPQQQTIVIGPRETRSLHLNPELLPAAYTNDEIRRAMLYVRAGTPAAETVYAQSRPVLIHGASDLYWGQRFSNAQYVARWVTPHDDEVLALISRAKRWVPNGRFSGYRVAGSSAQQAAWVRQQSAAIFQALKDSGITYVSSIFTFGDFVGQAQRIRLPRETLKLTNANCIDVSVAFASALENLGLQPVIVIVPGHAFVGVRLAPGSEDVLYLDLTVLPKGTLAAGVSRAQDWMKRVAPDKVLTIDIAAARLLKIYPLPTRSGSTSVQTAAVASDLNSSDE
ncbi:MAG TPA: hypothetical protein VMZ25_01740 [Terriglobales bacterium]|nr:hypothetical protein [Terriglobales bacterium]